MISVSQARFAGSFQVKPLTNPDQKRFKQFESLAGALQQIATQHDVSITVQQEFVKETSRTAKLEKSKTKSTLNPAYTSVSDPITYIDVISTNKRKEKAADNAVLRLVKSWLPEIEMPKKLDAEPIQWIDSDIHFLYHPQTQSRNGGYPGYDPVPKWFAFDND